MREVLPPTCWNRSDLTGGEMSGGGRLSGVTLQSGSAGRLAPPGDSGHAGRVTLPSVVDGFQSALGRDVLKLEGMPFIRGTFSQNYAIMCHG